MMLRSGTAPFQIEMCRWKGVPQEERMCRECRTNVEVEDCNHWLLHLLSVYGSHTMCHIEIYNTFRGSMAAIMLALRDWWYESHYSWSKLDCFWAPVWVIVAAQQSVLLVVACSGASCREQVVAS